MIQAASFGLQSLLTLVNLLKVSCQQSCPGQHDVNSLRFVRMYGVLGRCYESHLWDSFLYGAEDADFAGPAVTLRCPDIL